MFTGLVAGLGTVLEVEPIGDGRIARLAIATPSGFLDATQNVAAVGASIACSGCCLTAVTLDADRFEVEVSQETLSLTSLGTWRPGTRINLERSLRMGDELGGHLVSGHVDGLGTLVSRDEEQGSWRLVFRAPPPLARFIAAKGSIAIDGVSLTVNHVADDVAGDGRDVAPGATFGVNVIPHTNAVTTLGGLAPGDTVNLEIDMLARYVARLADTRVPGHDPGAPAASPGPGQAIGR